jgi:hypothetical protein
VEDQAKLYARGWGTGTALFPMMILPKDLCLNPLDTSVPVVLESTTEIQLSPLIVTKFDMYYTGLLAFAL